MIIDCDECAVRGPACEGCVVTVLLGRDPEGVELDDLDRRAMATLAGAGLVPPLRLMPIPTRSEQTLTPGREDTG